MTKRNSSVANANEVVTNEVNETLESKLGLGLELEADEVSTDGLEDADEVSTDGYTLEFLTKNIPSFSADVVSSKFDVEREEKIQKVGLPAIIAMCGDNINPLIILLGKWWEVKPARAAIKKMIDAEATAKGMASDVYLQIELRKPIDSLKMMGTAIDRLSYAVNYFKPRKGIGAKIVYKSVTVGGTVYSVDSTQLELNKANMTIEELRAWVKANGTTSVVEEL